MVAESATKSQIEEVKEETALPETVSFDFNVEIPVHEELNTDKDKNKVVQLVSEDQKETSPKE